MKKINFIKYGIFTGLLAFGVSCTNLDEQILDGYANTEAGGGTVDNTGELKSAYRGLRDFQGQEGIFAMGELTGDALVAPVRGGDWFDFGKLVELHAHTWSPYNVVIKGTYNTLLSNISKCNTIVDAATGTPLQITEARFLRAFYYYHMVDLFGSVPFREPKSDPKAYATVKSRTEATAYIISELEAILPNLPTRAVATSAAANKDAAHFLLAKIYLNKAVFTSATPEAITAANFAKPDMDKVVEHVDAISSTLNTGATDGSNYWLNFAPNNNTSNEVLFVSANDNSEENGIRSRWYMCSHYSQTPSGWNGFSVVADYYDQFDPTDKRILYETESIIKSTGNPVGMRIGQQFNAEARDAYGNSQDKNKVDYTADDHPAGTIESLDRKGRKLIFTHDITLATGGATIETAGIRPVKYIPDPAGFDKPKNDYVFFRYADALLMKEEAILRGGSGTSGSVLADLAARAGVTADANTLDGIYKARAKELWLEGWRRNDMIRFGKFLSPKTLKAGISDKKYVLFPFPSAALLNPNIKQNPGY